MIDEHIADLQVYHISVARKISTFPLRYYYWTQYRYSEMTHVVTDHTITYPMIYLMLLYLLNWQK